MSTRTNSEPRLEKYAWIALVACIATVPLAASKVPFLEVPLTFDAFGFPQSVALALGVSVILAIWGAAIWTRQARLFVAKPMIAFAVFAGWAAVATVGAYEPLRSLLGRSLSSLSLMNIVAYTALALLAMQLVGTRQRMRVLSWAVVASSSVVALIALVQQIFNANVFGLASIEDWVTSRGFSTLGNPDHLGTFLVLPLLIAAFLFLFEEDGKSRIAAGACVALLTTALTGTLTRGAWIAAITGGVLALVLLLRARLTPSQGRRALVLLGLCVAAVAIALLASDFTDLATRFRSPQGAVPSADTTLETVNVASSDRINVWRSALLIVGERPLTGTGPAAFELGWYRNAIDPSSGGGGGGIADDPHSLIVYVLATTGIPGVLAYLVMVCWALAFGAKTSMALTKGGAPSGKAVFYVAWFVAACGLQVALLVGAVSAPIVMYAFLSLAVLLRPTAHPIGSQNAETIGPLIATGVSAAVAVALVIATFPSLSAEIAVASALGEGRLEQARSAAESVPWNVDVQKAYFHSRVEPLNAALASGSANARDDLASLSAELENAGVRQPREYYYPSVRAQLFTEASSRLRDDPYAEAAVEAADEALAIMPASIPTRVHRAIALGNLARYEEMAETLAPYWENETSSAFPGILYAQALALSGNASGAEQTFRLLLNRFPAETTTITEAQSQVGQPAQ